MLKSHGDAVLNKNKQSGAVIKTSSLHYRTCPLCEAMCGLAIEYEQQQIISIKGDKDDPFSQGYLCAKAAALQDIHEDPDRLTGPVKRTATGWRTISWQAAFDESAEKIKALQDSYGKDTVATYIGNPTAHNHGNLMMLKGFLGAIGSVNRYSATSVDQLPLMLASMNLFGSTALFPIPDVDRMTLLIIVGANPLASGGSFMSGPDIQKRFESVKKRPRGRIVTIDPRFTETSAVASEHHFISPGHDAYFLLAMVQHIFAQGLEDTGALPVENLEALRMAVKEFSPQRVAAHIDFSAEVICDLARSLALEKNAAIYGRLGTSIQEYGSLCSWLMCVLNIITGNLDVPGGMMFTRPAIDLAGLGAFANEVKGFDTRRSRVRQLPDFAGEFPAATLADEMLVRGDGQVRALVTLAGNPVLSVPNGGKMEQGLRGLDFMLSFDLYINESSQYADIIIPPTSPLERSHYDIAIQLVALRHQANYSQPLFEPPEGAYQEWQSMLEVLTRINSKTYWTRFVASVVRRVIYYFGDEGVLDLLLKNGPYGGGPDLIRKTATYLAGIRLFNLGALMELLFSKINQVLRKSRRINALLESSPLGTASYPVQGGLSIDKLKQHPHGIDIGPLQPVMPARLNTKNKQINLAPGLYGPSIKQLVTRMTTTDEARDKKADSSQFDLQLIGRRHLRSNNSWLHNSHRLVKGKSRCTAQLHPADAQARHLLNGQAVKVSSEIGSIELALEVTDRIKRGVVSIPHGWGHHRPQAQLRRAAKSPGVSVNDITNDHLVEDLTGLAVCNGVPVKVEAVIEGARSGGE